MPYILSDGSVPTVIPHAAVDKGRFTPYTRSIPAGTIASKAPHTKQARLRERGAAPTPTDKHFGHK